MRLPKRREILRYPLRIELTEETLGRVEEFLRLEDYRDIQTDRLCVTAARGGKAALLLPLGDPREKPHTLEISVLEIRYRIDLWYLGFSRKDAWVFENEAILLQEFVSQRKMPRLDAVEIKEKIQYNYMERCVDFGFRIFLIAIVAFLVLFMIQMVAFLTRSSFLRDFFP